MVSFSAAAHDSQAGTHSSASRRSDPDRGSRALRHTQPANLGSVVPAYSCKEFSIAHVEAAKLGGVPSALATPARNRGGIGRPLLLLVEDPLRAIRHQSSDSLPRHLVLNAVIVRPRGPVRLLGRATLSALGRRVRLAGRAHYQSRCSTTWEWEPKSSWVPCSEVRKSAVPHVATEGRGGRSHLLAPSRSMETKRLHFDKV